MHERVLAIRRKKPEEIEIMARAGVILAECLEHVASVVAPGLATWELDVAAATFIRDHGCTPSFLGYNGYPRSICISVNEEAVHGIPGERVIEEGDLVSLDCGVILDGWQSDSGMTVTCGDADAESMRLMEATQRALEAGIAAARPGNHVGDIGAAVSGAVRPYGYTLLRDHGGHGIGRQMHEPPHIPNEGTPGQGNELKEGLVLAIEPIVNAGTDLYRTEPDGWTVVTADGRRSCYFEHTVAITAAGPRVLTRRSSEFVTV
ncbi:MAG TPA: type I methionyl aminopeptidase [Candidatus Dormibacteraeota bacterium]|nr:type I methionyl aminopeptidase [Candidatus Dormibacteraeota bacterium]